MAEYNKRYVPNKSAKWKLELQHFSHHIHKVSIVAQRWEQAISFLIGIHRFVYIYRFIGNFKSATSYVQWIPMLFAKSEFDSSITVHKLLSWINTAPIRWIAMKLSIVSTYCYLSVMLSHSFHPVDENGRTFAQSVNLYKRFSSFGWKPMKSKLLINGKVGGWHWSNLSQWNLFCPLNQSAATYRLVKSQYFFSALLHFTMTPVWN